MALDLYLVVVTANGPLFGSGASQRLENPLRNNAAVNRPLVVSDSTFGVDAPASTTGGSGPTASKPDPTELTVTLPDDSATPALFSAICSGSRLISVDVLAATTATNPRVVSATGIGNALVTSLSRTVTTDGVVLKLAFDGQKFSVGSAPERSDGSYGTFTFLTFDLLTGRVG